jgi:putative intracellular protease/amidase
VSHAEQDRRPTSESHDVAAVATDDLGNAGATWEDISVIADGRRVTSRKPDDLPDFCQELVNTFGVKAPFAHDRLVDPIVCCNALFCA